MNRSKVPFIYWIFSLLCSASKTGGIDQLTHIRNPVKLSIGECITFKAEPAYPLVGNWTWRKDTNEVRSGLSSSRLSTNKNVLTITDVQLEDSAYYSAEVQTTERMELFKFWLNVQGCYSNEKKTAYFQGNCKSWCEKKCDHDWNYFDGACYKYFGNLKTWEEALDSCLSQGAQLAEINSEKENKFVALLLESGEGAWIGLSDRNEESTYLWNNDKDAKASYFQWAKNEPSNTNSVCNIENCVEMKYPSLKWNDMVCNGVNSYVCQVSKGNVNVTPSWTCYGNHCYKYFPTQHIWKDSEMKCEEFGGELARITSSSLNQVVGGIIKTNVWIGLNDIAEPGTYVWKDFNVGKMSNKASYFNWDSGEPNDKLYGKLWIGKCSGEDCVQMSNWDNGVTWHDRECSTSLPYVCEKVRVGGKTSHNMQKDTNKNTFQAKFAHFFDSFLTLAAALGITGGCTAATIIIAALIQSRLKKRKFNVQSQRLVFNHVTRYNRHDM